MSRWWQVAGVMGALAVALGAFGAHGLKNRVTEARLLEVWGTAAQYHMFAALALCAVAVHPAHPPVAGSLFVAGTVLFSGSLYTMTLTGQTWLGAITPLGGLCFIGGWIALALGR